VVELEDFTGLSALSVAQDFRNCSTAPLDILIRCVRA
jgi:hypothetical protein